MNNCSLKSRLTVVFFMKKSLENFVFFACNEGGHFSQLMALKDLFGMFPSILVTDNERANKSLAALKCIEEIEYAMGDVEMRKKLKDSKKEKITHWDYLPGYISLFRQCFSIWKKYRPKVIVSTGSNIAVPLFIIGRLHGSKCVFIETRARVYGKTLTGKILTYIANKIIVQWPEMVDVYKGRAEYLGTLV